MANELLWGFYKGLRDQINVPVTQVPAQTISQAIETSLDRFNTESQRMQRIFLDTTTDHTRRYETAGITRNQPLDAVGRALANRAGGYYDIGLPLRRSGNAFGYDWEAFQDLTVQQVNNRLSTMMIGDIRWNRDHMLAAMFTNVSYNFPDERWGTIVVKPLANGDTDKYLVTSGAEQGATDNHFLFQNAAIADAANPLPTIKNELLEHPENGGDVILFHGTDLTDDFMGLAGFVTKGDSNVRPGTAVDTLIGDLGVQVPGRLYGYCDGVWLVEWSQIPTNYALAVTSAPTAPPLLMRQPTNVALQGFKQVGQREDFPWYERQFRRYAGYGANNRVGAVAIRFGAGAYAIPANFTAPLPN